LACETNDIGTNSNCKMFYNKESL